MHLINDLFGIQVIVSMNMINHVVLVSIYENCKCKRKSVDKLVEECTENVEEVKLGKMKMCVNVVLECCTFFCFQHLL